MVDVYSFLIPQSTLQALGGRRGNLRPRQLWTSVHVSNEGHLFKYFIWMFLNLSVKVTLFFLCLNIWSGMWSSEYYLYKLPFLLSSDNRFYSQAHRGELESQWRQLLFSVVDGITGSSFSLLPDSYCLPCDLCMSVCERDLEEVCFFTSLYLNFRLDHVKGLYQ